MTTGGALGYGELRATWILTIAATLRTEARRRPVPEMRAGGWWFTFTWCEPDRRRDPDNVRAGGTKLILDALVAAGILPADDTRFVKGFRGDYYIYNAVHVGVDFEMSSDFESRTWPCFIPHRLPDANEIGEAQQLEGQRRGQAWRR